jgi:hypothetical protein
MDSDHLAVKRNVSENDEFDGGGRCCDEDGEEDDCHHIDDGSRCGVCYH